MRALVARLSDDELSLPPGNDWTISVALAHLAFWDQRSFVLLGKWISGGIELSPIDVDISNDSLLPTWLGLPPRTAANLAVSAAEAIDNELALFPLEFISRIESLGEKRIISAGILAAIFTIAPIVYRGRIKLG